MKKNWDIIFLSILFFAILVLVKKDLINLENKINKQVQEKINMQTDFRYKSIDNELALKIEKYSKNITKCFDITNEEIKEYYKKHKIKITPFGRMLLRGEHRCQ